MISDESGSPAGTSGETRRPLLGELLIQANVIAAEQLAEALSAQREPVNDKKLGQLLIDRGLITEAQLTQTLSLQLSVPWVSLYHIDFSRQLLNRVEREIAERYCLIPIFVRHVKGQGETLYVAMDDPTNEAALAEVSRQANLPARPMIASATDIRSAIRVYYGEPAGAPVVDVPAPPTRADPPVTTREGHHRDEAAPSTVPTAADPPGPAPGPPPVPRQPPPVPAPHAAAPAADVEPPPPTSNRRGRGPLAETGHGAAPPEPAPRERAPREKERATAARRPQTAESDMRRRGRAAMLNLTFLDGTTIALPSAKKKAAGSPDSLTARDFVSALRATAHGADASEVLGETPHWEPVVAALLSILLRKGLIADWEFIEELRKG